MRIVDLQMSMGGSAPVGAQTGALQAMQGYRFFKDVEHARKENLHRQESVVPNNPSTSSLLVQDSLPHLSRTYVNRAPRREGREERREEAQEKQPGRYESLGRRILNVSSGQKIDFLA